ncbi:MAG: CmcI family methyltransferase, partial [Gaiellaceae bacterium]
MSDDREQFERERREAAARMAADEQLGAAALEVNAAADAYDWSYQWNWLGLPVIQMPPDIVVLQEVIWETRPQLVIETGIARGGSLVLYASILELLGEGSVLGIDIDIRQHNRDAIEAHPLAHRIRMTEGSSVGEEVLAEAGRAAAEVERVMVV